MRVSLPPKPQTFTDIESFVRWFNSRYMEWVYRLWAVENWTFVAVFSNGWVNVGAPSYGAAYYNDTFGIVRIRGRISTGTTGTTAFILPVGYRPISTIGFSVSGGTVTIDASGNVTPTGSSLYLDNISFRAEA